MSALSPAVVIEFCKACGWAYETWLNHCELFDKNARKEDLQKSFAAETLARLNIISQEYSLLQIVKLHDRAVVSGNITLGLEYVVTYGGWPKPTLDKLESLKNKLDGFANQLRSARNKSLSHNDLAAIAAGATLGAFPAGTDAVYFETLQDFVNVVHNEVIGGPWPFNDLVKNDVSAFINMLKS
jgi:hypothetical protein